MIDMAVVCDRMNEETQASMTQAMHELCAALHVFSQSADSPGRYADEARKNATNSFRRALGVLTNGTR